MTEHSQETKIAILEAKVDHMMGHVKELTLRVRANEKVVASVSLLGVIACTFVGAGYFAPKAEAHMGHSFPTGEWIQKIREYEAKKIRPSVKDSINNALGDFYWEDQDGSNDPTEQEELLQLQSSDNRQSIGWRYD